MRKQGLSFWGGRESGFSSPPPFLVADNDGGGREKAGYAFSFYLSEHGTETYDGKIMSRKLLSTSHCFRRLGARRGEEGVPREEDWALCDVEVGDELVFARGGMDRDLFMWSVKKTQGG